MPTGRPAYPQSFIIDIHNLCNAACPYCPYPKAKATLEPRHMEWCVFRKIVDDIRGHTDDVRALTVCGMSEPFMTDYLFDCLDYGRGLPWCLQTNCSLLTAEKARRLEAVGFAGPILAHFGPEMGINLEQAQANFEYARSLFGPERVIHKPIAKLTNRAGAAWSVPELRATDCSSGRPYRQMGIGVTGEVHYCCDDMLHRFTLGDLTTQSIAEVWNGRPFEAAIQAMHEGRNPLCNVCLRAKERRVYEGAGSIAFRVR